MFSRVKNFFYRHKRKFVISGIIVGGTVILSRYAHKKFIEWQDKETKEFLERTRKQYQFENIERTCNQSIVLLAVSLKNSVNSCFDSESILLQLRSTDTGSKLQLWETLKIQSFAKHSALLYSGAMLTILFRIQLNIIGNYIGQNNLPENGSVHENYLSLCQHFISNGCKDLCTLIEKHVKHVIKGVSLQSEVTLKDIEHLFWKIQSEVSEDPLDPLSNLSKYLFSYKSKKSNTEDHKKYLDKLVDHTKNLLESENVTVLAQSCVGRAYSNSIDRLAEFLVKKRGREGKDSNENDVGFIHPNSIRVPLAKVIPIVHGINKLEPIGVEADPWIQQFLLMEPIKSLGAGVFDAFSKIPIINQD